MSGGSESTVRKRICQSNIGVKVKKVENSVFHSLIGSNRGDLFAAPLTVVLIIVLQQPGGREGERGGERERGGGGRGREGGRHIRTRLRSF